MIEVKPEGKKFKIMVNFVQTGPLFTSHAIANSEAKKIKEKQAHLTLQLVSEEPVNA